MSLLQFSVVLFFLTWCSTPGQVVSKQNGHIESCHEHHAMGESVRLSPFAEISQSHSFLSVPELETFIDGFVRNLKCKEEDEHDEHQDDLSHQHCNKTLCINTQELMEFVAANSSLGMTEDQFEKASTVLLYLTTELDHFCHERVNMSLLTMGTMEANLLTSMHADSPDHPHIHTSGMKALLETIEASIDHDHHDHEEDDDHDDDHDEHEHDHDDHDSHHSDDHDSHHSDDHDSHHSDDESEPSSDEDHSDDSHSDEHDGHDDDHDEHDDEHDEDDHDHVRIDLVVQPRCLAPDAILYYMGKETSDFIESDELAHLASYIVYLLARGSDVEDTCRLLPQKEAFIQYLFSNYDGNSTHMPIEGLEEMMTSLGINPEAHEEGDSHDGHDHRRKRRSARALSEDVLLSKRVKRQAPGSKPLQQCFSAEQLTALYNGPSFLDQALFQQLCPSLISQQLYGDCTSHESHDGDDITDLEKYGYSSLAVFIVCLCSILGVVLVPCASHQLYDGIMAIFFGLAVGTLFSDAVLHLIPNAFGVHGHEDGHDHGSEIVVEEFAQYGIVIVAALYFFYILELVMSACGGHSHNEEKPHSFHPNGHVHRNSHTMSPVENGDEEKAKKYAVTDQGEKPHYDTITVDQGDTSRGFRAMPPIVTMIVLGDAIHNCADGLVIGASFSQSISTGIATSIAVFCHELPHELGDFAVLIESGCSFGKAVFLNLMSSLTAFVGLYIGLSLSVDSTTERWIFAIASGMFIYIALVNLLPKLVKGRGFNIVFHNIGILLGFGLMFLLVIFEEHIDV